MKMNIKKIVDLFNYDIVDDIVLVDTYIYNDEIKLKYVDDNIEFTISIKQKELDKLVDKVNEDNEND